MHHEAFNQNTMRTAEEVEDWNGVDSQDGDAVQAGAPPWPVLAALLGYGALVAIGVALVD